MSSHAPEALVNSEILLGSLEAADELDIDLGPFLKRHAIALEELKNPKGLLHFHQVVSFLNDVAKESHCPLFGFYVGRHQPSLRFGPLVQLQKCCATVGEAFERGIHYSQVYNQASQWVIEEDGKFILLKRFHRDDQNHSLVQLHYLALTLMIKPLEQTNLKATGLAGVYLSHAEPKNSEILQRYFEVPVYFNHSFTGYAVHRHVADIPIPTANPELLAVVESRLNTLMSPNDDNDKLLTKTTQLIRQNLGTSICNIEGIAQALSLHPRTLQRELKSHNTQFRDLLNKIRQETAEHYLLHSDISIADLSDMLGYQNPTAFTRAFKLNTGLPASRWQQYRAKNAP